MSVRSECPAGAAEVGDGDGGATAGEQSEGAPPVADESGWMRAVKEGTEEEVVWQCNNLLHWLKPTPEAEERRTMVFCHMRDVLRRHGTGLEGAEVFLTG